MPLVTAVVDDKSPLISYYSTWRPGQSTYEDHTDTLASDYYLGTHTANNNTGGSATFNFNGTAVWIYGAKRTNHGSYAVQIDSETFLNLSSEGNNVFQQVLFNASVNQGTHTVKMTNTATGGLYVDIDMIVWQSEVGNTDDQLVPETVQDTDPRFQYQGSAWGTTSSDSNLNLYLFNNGSGHITETYNASVTFTFTGTPLVQLIVAVSLFGTSGPSNGPYSVQLDGGQTGTYNATNAYPTNYGVMIYHADNLGPGSHEIVLTNLPALSGQSLAIDYVQLLTTTSTNTSSSSSTSVSQNSILSSGAIASVVIAVTAVLSAGLAFVFYRRWKDALATHQDLYRAYAVQQRVPPKSTTVPPTGFSSSLEMRSQASLLRNNNSAQSSSERIQQPVDNQGAVQISPNPPHSRGIIGPVSSPQTSVAKHPEQRPLSEAAGGGLVPAADLPNPASPRDGQNFITTDPGSIAGSEAPPNYTLAIINH